MSDQQPALIAVEPDATDRNYFTIVPHIVLAMCETPAELALWITIKTIAGENGQCTLDTEQLAALATISTGACHQARKSLMRKGLITGQLRRDPGYPRAVWHLAIPDLWNINLAWRQRHPTLRERIAHKQAQHDIKNIANVHLVNQPLQDSPGESNHSPGESDHSPGERKKNQKLEPEEERGQGQETILPVWLTALVDLEMSMTRAMFTAWIRPLRPVALLQRNGITQITLECPSEYIREWITLRLDVVIHRTLAAILQISPDQLVTTYTLTGEQP